MVLLLLEKFAAKDAKGNPCVANMGRRGTGHYVKVGRFLPNVLKSRTVLTSSKMLHNGIETGILSTMCEAWSLLHKSVGLPNSKTGQIFERWNSECELRNTYLLEIGAEICQRRKTPQGEGVSTECYVLDDVLDKAVQDADNSEGTLFWSLMDAVRPTCIRANDRSE